ncbi:MAG: energy transducer TonB [Nonlabens sp.]|uniref:energy transducer TonB n=1 Tax=Nonlabens sp. TaxID=1888209 RepID=UPI003219D7F6
MMKELLTLSFIFCFTLISAAQDKIWLDNDRKEVIDSTAAIFYRIKEIDDDAPLIKEETFYKSNDQLFSKGYLEQRTSYRTGTWQWFYSNGNKMRYINYSSGRIVGFLSTYNSNGHLMESYSYNKSRPGEMPFNYKFKKDNDGTLRIAKGKGPFNGAYVGNDKNIDSLSGNYKDHKATGLWKAYKNGVLIYEEVYQNGEIQSGKRYENGTSYSYNEYSKPAEPVVGIKKYIRKLFYNINYYYEQIDLKKNDYRTTFQILFDVNIDGSIDNIRIMNGMGKGPDEMAIKAIQNMKAKWNPALERGVKIKSTVSIPYAMESRECNDC